MQTLDYMHTLPLLRDLVICREASSHDRRGGNDNGFSNKAEFVRREGLVQRAVLDVAGPGSVYNFWYSWPNHPLAPGFAPRLWGKMVGKALFFFDGEESPRYAVELRDWFGHTPFRHPLAIHGDACSGGYTSYVPMAFEDGMRISVEGGGVPMFFHHIWYHTYPMGTAVSTWTGEEDLTRFLKGWDPEIASEAPAGEKRSVGAITIPGNGQADVAILKQGGTLLCIRMRLPENDPILRSTRLKIWWDEDTEPSVDAPLSLFYAIENRFSAKPMEVVENAPLQGLVNGRDAQGLFFFRLPMPYARRARLALENDSPQPVTIPEIRIEVDHSRTFPSLGKSVGYLRTQFRESRDLVPGRDYVLAHLHGRGHIVGTVLAVENTSETFLEGDERVYTDGCRSPLVIGDATETYFGGSWYFFERAWSLPLHGAPTFRMESRDIGAISEVTMYRFHLTDFIPYTREARFSIQHGPFNNVQGHYRSLVFYYGVKDKSLVQTDSLLLSSPEDRNAHAFAGTLPVQTERKGGFFEGEFNGQDLGHRKPWRISSPVSWMIFITMRGIFHDPPKDSPDRVSFEVCEHRDPYAFTVRVDPGHDAVKIRRLYDQSVADQKARVEVDGTRAGIWYNAGRNKWKIWAEDDLILDPSATAGKSEIRVRIVPLSPVFTAAEYKVFSIVLPD